MKIRTTTSKTEVNQDAPGVPTAEVKDEVTVNQGAAFIKVTGEVGNIIVDAYNQLKEATAAAVKMAMNPAKQ